MSYSPPSGNAANFNFTTATYAPPTGSAVPFPFGAGPTPPGGSGLPWRRYQHLFSERPWFPTLARRYAPVVSAAAVVPSFARSQRPWLFRDEWHPSVALGRRFAPSPTVAVVRPVLFVIT
jgi:hypothetical protein